MNLKHHVNITKEKLYQLIDDIKSNPPSEKEGWDNVISIPVQEIEMTPELKMLIAEQIDNNKTEKLFSDVIFEEDDFDIADNK